MYATGLTLFYYDQRVRKEGYDIEWMMEAAGMAVPSAIPTAHLDEPNPELAPQAATGPTDFTAEAGKTLPPISREISESDAADHVQG
jgi:hypothetical protein